MRTTVVAAAVIIASGRVLITQRKQGTHLEGKWEFPGGKVESGEDPRRALERELLEELGVVAMVGDIVEVTFHRYQEADQCVLLLFFEAALAPASPEPQTVDVAAFDWASADALRPERFPPADISVLKKVLAKLPCP
jgi:8-oxo-dGTP diphosphatase